MSYIVRSASALFPVACLLLYPIASAAEGTRGARFIALHLLLTALMAIAWWAAQRAPERDIRWSLWAGIAARLSLLAVPAFLSHDVTRYLWDGYLVTVGLDPYGLSPEAAAALHLTWPPVADSRQITAVYPPGATALFALCAWAGPAVAPWLWRALVTLGSIGVLLVADRLLEQSARRRHLPWVALSPVLVVESQVGLHLDVLSTLALLLALYWFRQQRALRAGAAIGAGIVFKLLPAFALWPALAIGGRQKILRCASAAALVVLVCYGGAVLAGLRPLGGLDSLFGKCQFGSPLYALLALLAGATWSRVVLALVFALALVGIWIWTRRTGRFEQAVMLAVAAPLVFTPVVYPWYLMMLVPLIAMFPSAWMVGWTLTLPITYEVIDRFDTAHVWEPAAWPLMLVALAWMIGGGIDGWRWSRARAQ